MPYQTHLIHFGLDKENKKRSQAPSHTCLLIIRIETKYTKEAQAKNILVRRKNTTVKIEINLVVRGALFPSTSKDLCSRAKMHFNTTLAARCLNFADVYGGKICAALDRQHPRDWYDCWVLLGPV